MGEPKHPDIQGKVNELVLEWEQFKLTFEQKPRLSREAGGVLTTPRTKPLRWTRNTRSLQSLGSRSDEAEIAGLLHKCISFKDQLSATLHGNDVQVRKRRLAFPTPPETSS